MILKKLKKIAKNRKLISRNIRDMEHMMQVSNRIETLQGKALNSSAAITSSDKVCENELIVSFTTFSAKIHDIHLVVEALSQQTVKANRVILWLDEQEFNHDNLPKILHRQMARGLEVRYCPNYRSYKKIIPTLKLFPDANIITIDDDVLYGYNFIELLVSEHKRHLDMIIGNRAHEIVFMGSTPVPYKKWKYGISDEKASHKIMLTGVGGIFYPANSLHEDVLDIELFTKLAPTTDDLWLKVMAIRNNTVCKKSAIPPKGHALKGNRNLGLGRDNIRHGGNDRQFKQLLDFYPEVKQVLQPQDI